MSTANQKPTESVSLNAFKQPKAFYLIFSIELWERFGYYGLQGIMAVYLVKQLGMSEADSITLFSSFSALVYGLVAIGGWLGDKVLGTKRVIMLGAIVLAIGYGLVAWSELGKMLNISTPLIDSFIEIGSIIINQKPRETGRTLKKLGIDNMSTEELKAYLGH